MKSYRSDPIFRFMDGKWWNEKDILRAYFDLFDKLFFGGTLKGHCELRLTSFSSLNSRTGLHKHIICLRPSRNFLKLRKIIVVYRPYWHTNKRDRYLYRIGTVLHEMVHAFFGAYDCLEKTATKVILNFSFSLILFYCLDVSSCRLNLSRG